ncbi:hypothetical protein CerSpe_214360 [Prunus speciosa]
METVEKDYNTGVSRQQVYRAKERALRQIEGIYTEQYSRIWDYCEELRKTNQEQQPKFNVISMTNWVIQCFKGYMCV